MEFCNLCTMRLRKRQNVMGSNISNSIHYGRAAYVQFDAIRRAIRNATPHGSILRLLGMDINSEIDTEELVAVAFATN